MFFEVLNHVDSALSVAVSLLALWQFLVAGVRPPARQSAFPLRTLAATDGRQCGDDEKSRRTNVDAGQ